MKTATNPKVRGIDEADLESRRRAEPGNGCGPPGGRSAALHGEPTRHPEMGDQGLAVVEGSDQELALPSHRLAPGARPGAAPTSAGAPLWREVRTWVTVTDSNGAPGHRLMQMASCDLDFG